MPAKHQAKLSQPIFHEPIFSEGQPLPSPTGFETKHPSDTKTYDEVEKLLKKDVVGVPGSRIADDDLFRLQDAYGGNHGPKVVGKIQSAKKIIFHALGDSGASNARKYGNELHVSDQVTVDCNQSDENNKPAFLFHLGDVVYNFGEQQYYYDQFYEPSGTIRHRSLRFQETTTLSSSRVRQRARSRCLHSSATSAPNN